MSTSVAVPESQPKAALATRTLSEQLTERGVTGAMWHTLTKSLYPGAKVESALMVLDYCRSRGLDPMKKPCHIVPMRVKGSDGQWDWRDVVLPGIYEYRTTAMRTGKYLGHTKPEYGEPLDIFGVSAPEWCSMTFKRLAANGSVIEFPVTVFFREVCNLKDGKANDRWSKAPIQMLTKCTEAAGLREAFPDEFGGEATFEEMSGRDEDQPTATPIRPAQRVSQATIEQQPNGGAKERIVLDEPTTPPAVETVDGEATPASSQAPPSSVGLIVEVRDMTKDGKVAAAVILDSGFVATTRSEELILAAATARDAKTRVEMVTTPSSNPQRFPPRLDELVPAEAQV